MLVVVSTRDPLRRQPRRSAGAGFFFSQPVVHSRLARRPTSMITITAPTVISRPTTNIPRPAQIAQSSLTPASASTSMPSEATVAGFRDPVCDGPRARAVARQAQRQ
jgi:hypothetical protein